MGCHVNVNWSNFIPCALGGTRTPNLLIRSQMLYPLSYKRQLRQSIDGFSNCGPILVIRGGITKHVNSTLDDALSRICMKRPHGNGGTCFVETI